MTISAIQHFALFVIIVSLFIVCFRPRAADLILRTVMNRTRTYFVQSRS